MKWQKHTGTKLYWSHWKRILGWLISSTSSSGSYTFRWINEINNVRIWHSFPYLWILLLSRIYFRELLCSTFRLLALSTNPKLTSVKVWYDLQMRTMFYHTIGTVGLSWTVLFVSIALQSFLCSFWENDMLELLNIKFESFEVYKNPTLAFFSLIFVPAAKENLNWTLGKSFAYYMQSIHTRYITYSGEFKFASTAHQTLNYTVLSRSLRS